MNLDGLTNGLQILESAVKRRCNHLVPASLQVLNDLARSRRVSRTFAINSIKNDRHLRILRATRFPGSVNHSSFYRTADIDVETNCDYSHWRIIDSN